MVNDVCASSVNGSCGDANGKYPQQAPLHSQYWQMRSWEVLNDIDRHLVQPHTDDPLCLFVSVMCDANAGDRSA